MPFFVETVQKLFWIYFISQKRTNSEIWHLFPLSLYFIQKDCLNIIFHCVYQNFKPPGTPYQTNLLIVIKHNWKSLYLEFHKCKGTFHLLHLDDDFLYYCVFQLVQEIIFSKEEYVQHLNNHTCEYWTITRGIQSTKLPSRLFLTS